MRILLFVIISIVSTITIEASERRQFFIKMETEDKVFYTGEAIPLNIVLYSVTPDVVNARETKSSKLSNGQFAYTSKVDVSDRNSSVEIDGTRYYRFPLTSFVVTFADKGKYKMQGGEYAVDFVVPSERRGGFFGPRRERKRINVPIDETAIKVKNLPNGAESFSGIIGDFEIETTIPPGDIVVNEEAILLITLRGEGILAKDIMPDYSDAFTGNLKLKSVSDRREIFIENGLPISVLRLECTFVPESRKNVEVGPVSIDFFNPKTGKYEHRETAPTPIDVKSSTIRREAVEI